MIESDIIREVFLPNRGSCFECLRKIRWPQGVKCIYCSSSKVHKDGYTDKGAAKYYCLNCGKYFNDLTNTVFHHHKFTIEEMEGDVTLKNLVEIDEIYVTAGEKVGGHTKNVKESAF